MQRSLGPRHPFMARPKKQDQAQATAARPRTPLAGLKPFLGSKLEAAAAAARRRFSHHDGQPARDPRRSAATESAMQSYGSPSSVLTLAQETDEEAAGLEELAAGEFAPFSLDHGPIQLTGCLASPVLDVSNSFADSTEPPTDSEGHLQPLLPGLPDDLGRVFLAHLARHDQKAARLVSKGWHAYVAGEEFHKTRKEWGLREGWLYALLRDRKDQLRWRALDPNTDTWHLVPDMPEECRQQYGMACASVNGCLFVIGGAGWFTPSKREVWCYEAMEGKWRRLADLNSARCYCTAAVVNGKVYALGGMGDEGGLELSSVEVYNAEEDRWSYVASMPEERDVGRVAVVQDKILVVPKQPQGNPDPEPAQAPAGYTFSPSADSWTTDDSALAKTLDQPFAIVDAKILKLESGSNGRHLLCFEENARKWLLLGSLPLVPAPTKLLGLQGRLYIVGRGGVMTVVDLSQALKHPGSSALPTRCIPSCDREADTLLSCAVVEA